MTQLLCDRTGWLLDEIDARVDDPCGKPATHRYRRANDPTAEWRGRCAEDATWSDRSLVVVEEIGEAS